MSQRDLEGILKLGEVSHMDGRRYVQIANDRQILREAAPSHSRRLGAATMALPCRGGRSCHGQGKGLRRHCTLSGHVTSSSTTGLSAIPFPVPEGMRPYVEPSYEGEVALCRPQVPEATCRPEDDTASVEGRNRHTHINEAMSKIK